MLIFDIETDFYESAKSAPKTTPVLLTDLLYLLFMSGNYPCSVT